MTPFGTATHHRPAAFAAATPFGESSTASASPGATPSESHAAEVDIRGRFRRARPRRGRTRDRSGRARRAGSGGRGPTRAVELDAIATASPADAASSSHATTPGRIASPASSSGYVPERVACIASRSTATGGALVQHRDEIEHAEPCRLRRPFLERQRRAAVRVERLLPPDVDRRLGVEDETVEVEHDRADVGRVTRRPRLRWGRSG